MAGWQNGEEQGENHRVKVVRGKGKLDEGGNGDVESFW